MRHVGGRKVWSKREVARLRELAQTMLPSEIADELGRTETAVRFKAHRLGIKCRSYDEDRKWSKAEDLKLLELAGQVSLEAAARRIGKSVAALKARAGRLGVSWRQGSDTLAEVARRLQVSEGAVRRRRDALNQRWRKRTSSFVSRGPTIDEVKEIAKAILEDPASNVGCPLRHLKAIAKGEA